MKKFLGSMVLKLLGWKLKSDKFSHDIDRMIMVAAPHTTNWDFPITMAVFLKMGIKIRFLAKKSLFKFPLGIIMKTFGGIPVDRSKSNNLVDEVANIIHSYPKIVLLVPVEGTRATTKGWKSGFYYMAKTAEVPIGLGYLDYEKKEAGFFPTFMPTGNYEEDLKSMQTYYQHVAGKYPERSAIYQKKASS